MGRSSIKIVGVADVSGHHVKVTRSLAKHTLTAMLAGTLIAQARWKELAPVKTGTYRRSIHTEGKIDGNTVTVTVGTNLNDPPYPVFLEYGTRHMAPHPSARPAFDQTLAAVLRTARDTLARLIKADR